MTIVASTRDDAVEQGHDVEIANTAMPGLKLSTPIGLSRDRPARCPNGSSFQHWLQLSGWPHPTTGKVAGRSGLQLLPRG
jgi:hypothetical protein